MPEPGPQFACVGCGAMNPVGAEACSGCGHRFAGPAAGPPPRRREAVPTATSRETRQGRPGHRGGGVASFARVAGGVFLVVLSSLIAFVGTCFPIGLAGMQGEFQGGPLLTVAFVVGVAVALVVGVGLTRFLTRGRRRGKPEARSREDRP